MAYRTKPYLFAGRGFNPFGSVREYEINNGKLTIQRRYRGAPTLISLNDATAIPIQSPLQRPLNIGDVEIKRSGVSERLRNIRKIRTFIDQIEKAKGNVNGPNFSESGRQKYAIGDVPDGMVFGTMAALIPCFPWHESSYFHPSTGFFDSWRVSIGQWVERGDPLFSFTMKTSFLHEIFESRQERITIFSPISGMVLSKKIHQFRIPSEVGTEEEGCLVLLTREGEPLPVGGHIMFNAYRDMCIRRMNYVRKFNSDQYKRPMPDSYKGPYKKGVIYDENLVIERLEDLVKDGIKIINLREYPDRLPSDYEACGEDSQYYIDNLRTISPKLHTALAHINLRDESSVNTEDSFEMRDDEHWEEWKEYHIEAAKYIGITIPFTQAELDAKCGAKMRNATSSKDLEKIKRANDMLIPFAR